MADEKTKPAAAAPPAGAPTPGGAAAAPPAETLEQIHERLLRDKRSLEGKLAAAKGENLAELKKKNAELKDTLNQMQQSLVQVLAVRKNPLDAAGFSDKLQTLKLDVAAYAEERKLDPSLWKKLESL